MNIPPVSRGCSPRWITQRSPVDHSSSVFLESIKVVLYKRELFRHATSRQRTRPFTSTHPRPLSFILFSSSKCPPHVCCATTQVGRHVLTMQFGESWPCRGIVVWTSQVVVWVSCKTQPFITFPWIGHFRSTRSFVVSVLLANLPRNDQYLHRSNCMHYSTYTRGT